MLEYGLFAVSIVAWLICWPRREAVTRLLYPAIDRRFVKRPNLDVGLVFLFAFANLAVVTIIAAQLSLVNKEPVAEPVHLTSNFRQEGEAGEAATNNRADATDSPPAATDGQSNNLSDQTPTTPSFRPAGQLAQKFGLLVILVAMMIASRWVYDSQWWQWGWGPLLSGTITRTALAGIIGFLLIVPPVLLLHEILTMALGYQHQTLNEATQLKDQGKWQPLTLVLVNTCLLVPLSEEIIFRSIIQGFAEQFVAFRHNAMRLTIGPMNTKVAKFLGVEGAAQQARLAKPTKRPSTQTAWGPIIFSSAVFALAHVGQGAAPISLYLLSMGLGWLYQKSGNLTVCILIHALLNSWTMGQLLWG